jgi:hypothetical protein
MKIRLLLVFAILVQGLVAGTVFVLDSMPPTRLAKVLAQ